MDRQSPSLPVLAAVAAAYGWEWPLPEEEPVKRLFALNQGQAQIENGIAAQGLIATHD